ncbi:SDR family NAD(P)-dependent oxidoreductase [Achromobacter sp. NPDC058515]|uniref:SDR family NAD(P)-dependent oxidoreductase n=1 Tax=Achromobacter sp. NPDC058515 TaxID=3346533 RepID=UPI0036486E70
MACHDRTALVTGGASGIGLACVKLLQARGARVLVADLDQAAAAAAAGDPTNAFALDAASLEAVQALADRLRQQDLRVDWLVNCAGIVQDPLAPQDLPPETYRRVLAVDLDGTYHFCSVFGTAMAQAGYGSIVNVASVAGMRSMPLHAYSPAKAAVISLTECLAGEWGRSGVRVNAVSPGYTVTAALRDQMERGLRDPEKLTRNSALGVLIQPEAIAHAIAFLLSDEASVITGVNLPVDAGWLLSGSWNTFGGVRPAYRSR